MNVISKISFKSDCIVLKDVRAHIGDICEQQHASSETTKKIVLAVNEACMNIIQHGYDNESDHEFTIITSLEQRERSKVLVMQLIDQAKKVDPLKIKSRDLGDVKPGGIGVHIIHELMDSVIYVDQKGYIGNILELRKTL